MRRSPSCLVYFNSSLLNVTAQSVGNGGRGTERGSKERMYNTQHVVMHVVSNNDKKQGGTHMNTREKGWLHERSETIILSHSRHMAHPVNYSVSKRFLAHFTVSIHQSSSSHRHLIAFQAPGGEQRCRDVDSQQHCQRELLTPPLQ
jgi:hypothetical protein